MTSGRELTLPGDAGGGELATRREPVQGLNTPLVVTREYVQATVTSMNLLREMVTEVLVEGRDYGSVPGVPDFLWDAGAQAIISSYNCHAGHRRILRMVQDHGQISVVLEVPIIHNMAQVEVATGVGAATTEETKNKYRWERNPQEWGYTQDQIDKLKTRVKGEGQDWEYTEYNILNPEPGELLNTIIKIASKRGEVDAAEALPGAAAALKELLDPPRAGGQRKGFKRTGNAPERDNSGQRKQPPGDATPVWTAYWSQARALLGDIAEKEGVEVSVVAHRLLGVTSTKDWLDQNKGKTLDDAVKAMSDALQAQGGAPPAAAAAAEPPKGGQPPVVPPKPKWSTVNKSDVKTWAALENLFVQLTGKQPRVMYAELGGGKAEDMGCSPWEGFLAMKDRFAPRVE